jgi:predicted O-methyltransferase YrrM
MEAIERTGDLPVIRMESIVRRGRNPGEGYARGWGLEFGDVRERLYADPVYLRSCDVSGGRTLLAEHRQMNLYLLIKHFLGRLGGGNVLELGTYTGGSALFMASAMQTFLPAAWIVGVDTFTGIPYSDRSVDAHSAGDFAGVDLDELIAYKTAAGLDNLDFIKGRFEDVLPQVLDAVAPLALVHIDCDVRDGVAFAYEAVRERMVPGGYIVFDDATIASCIGATEAIEELVVRRDGRHSEQVYPHYVFRVGLEDDV